MATPVFYQTMNNVGVDVTQYSTAVFTAGGSITPELPAAPFLPGTKAVGSDGSEFIFVQATTSISLTDFVLIDVAPSAGVAYRAQSLTSTNVQSSNAVGIGSTGLVLRQSVTLIPGGAFFWALTKGQYVPATTSGGNAINQGGGTGLATNVAGCLLYTSSVAGILSSVSTSASLQTWTVGAVCINSLTVSIPASLAPPAGDTKSNGFTVGPVVNINGIRPLPIGGGVIALPSTLAGATSAGVNVFTF